MDGLPKYSTTMCGRERVRVGNRGAERGACSCCSWMISLSRVRAQLAQYVLPPGSVVYTGCVGDDELAEQLRAANAREDVASAYQVKKGEKTVVSASTA